MNFKKKETVYSLFSLENITFSIPDYQRAYSWEKEQYEQFFADLYEQSQSENNYFFGNILLEIENEKSSILEIVDGQQRMTTIIIFIRAFINVYKEKMRGKNIETEINNLLKIYLASDGNSKLIPSKIDRDYFNSVIINNENMQAKTLSQTRINNAKNYFTRKLRNIKQTTDLSKILNKLQQSIITVTPIYNKVDSAFMFELQNNRGKKTTDMEQVKAYLLYQLYINEKSVNVNEAIEKLVQLFSKIYLYINDIKYINEDDLLWYHCNAYYGYSSINDNYDSILDFLKDALKNKKEINDKIEFILTFVNDLEKTFSSIHDMEKNKMNYRLKRLNLLGIPGIIFPVIINGYRYINEKEKEKYLEKFFHICELLAFRLEIIRTNGNVKTSKRLDNILEFKGDLNKLYRDIKYYFSDEEWRWSDESMYEVLMGPVYEKVPHSVIHFIFKIYEQAISGRDFPKLKNIWIEHISPQSPNTEKESGYDITTKNTYGVKFISQYLHCLGNLILSTKKQQYELGKKKFKEKLKIYNKNDLGLKHQTELNKYINNTKVPKWGEIEIKNRRKDLVDFAWEQWSFEKNDKFFI